MATEVKAPVFPESVSEGTLMSWYKQPGEAVRMDEKLADIGARLRENESGLRAGRAELAAARKRLDRVGEVLGAVGRVLDVLAGVIRFPVSR